MKSEICECGLLGFATESQVKAFVATKRDVKKERFWDFLQCPTGSYIYHAFNKEKKTKEDWTKMVLSGKCRHVTTNYMGISPMAKSIMFNNGQTVWYRSKEELTDFFDKITAAYVRMELAAG